MKLLRKQHLPDASINFENFEKTDDGMRLTRGSNVNIVHLNNLIQHCAGSLFFKGMQIPVPHVKLLRTTSDLDDAEQSNQVPLSVIERFKHLTKYLSTVVASLSGVVDINFDDEAALGKKLTKLSNSIIDKLELESSEDLFSDYKKMLATVDPKAKTLVSDALKKDVTVSLKTFALTFFQDVYLNDSVIGFLNAPSHSGSAEEHPGMKDMIMIKKTIKTVAMTASSGAEASITFQQLLSAVSRPTRALFSYLDRLGERDEAFYDRISLSKNNLPLIYPSLYKRATIRTGPEDSPLSNSMIIDIVNDDLSELNFNDSLALASGVVSGHPLSLEDLSDAKETSVIYREGFEIEIKEPDVLGVYMRSVRPNVASAVRAALVMDGARLSTALNYSHEGLSPSNLPADVVENLAKQAERLFNCARIFYSSEYESDKSVTYLSSEILKDLKTGSSILKKFPDIDLKMDDDVFKSVLNVFLSDDKALFSQALDLYSSNETTAFDHTSKKKIDVQIQKFFHVCATKKIFDHSTPALVSFRDSRFLMENPFPVADTSFDLKIASSSDMWGSTDVKVFIAPSLADRKNIERRMNTVKGQDWYPHQYSAGFLLGDPDVWRDFVSYHQMPTTRLPVVTEVTKYESFSPVDDQGRLDPNYILSVFPTPDVFKDPSFARAVRTHPESIDLYPYDLVSRLTASDDRLVALPSDEETLEKRIARLLIGDLQNLSIKVLKTIPNAVFFFKNLKETSNLSDLVLRYPNSTPVDLPKLTEARHSILLRQRPISDFLTPVVISRNSDISSIGIAEGNKGRWKLGAILDKLVEKSRFSLVPKTELFIFNGSRREIPAFAEKMAKSVKDLYSLNSGSQSVKEEEGDE